MGARPFTGSLLIALALLLALLPTALLLEVTPDWRLAQWSLAIIVVGLTLCWIFWRGGRPWLFHFSFATAFILLAVPWPIRFEQALTGALTELVTGCTLTGLDLCHVPAVRHGKVFELGGGLVGVEAACSGVRSFQGMLMVSLFLGQLRALSWRKRFLLIAIGVAAAFLGNVIRTLTLALIADRQGVGAIEKWHDPAGFSILLLCIVVLAWAANALESRPIDIEPGARLTSPHSTVPWLAAGIAVWVFAVVAFVEGWYRSAPATSAAWWTIAWPVDRTGFSELPMVEEARAMHFDTGRAARWSEPSGSQWKVFFSRWLPGKTTSRILARFHQPTVCLPAAGMPLIAETGVKVVTAGAVELRFRTYVFEENGRPVFVYFCVWEDRNAAPGDPRLPESWTARGRWNAVCRRARELGQQVLEIGIAGLGDPHEADAEFDRVLPSILRPDTVP